MLCGSLSCSLIVVSVMSTQDSVNTVYKCMLKSAADYLVKPLRRNELRNLWQHVWRRQSSQSLVPGSFPIDESVGHEKPEGASANNSTSNHENAFERDQRPVIGNGGDDQVRYGYGLILLSVLQLVLLCLFLNSVVNVCSCRAHVQDQRCKVRAQTWRTQLKKPLTSWERRLEETHKATEKKVLLDTNL